MSHPCEVRITAVPAGVDRPSRPLTLDIPDDVYGTASEDQAVRAARIRTWVDGQVSNQMRGRTADGTPSRAGVAPGEVSYDVFVEKDGTAGLGAGDRLGFGADRTTLQWGTTARHPLTANIRAMQGDILRAGVSGLQNVDLDPQTEGDQTLSTNASGDASIDYVSDGQDGVSQTEAAAALARFQALFTNDATGHRMLARAYQTEGVRIRFGTGPGETISLRDAYRIAGAPTPDGNSRPTIPGQPGAAEDPNAPDPLRRAFATGDVDTGEIQRRLRKLEQQLRDLEARLRMGIVDPVDAHSQMMNLFAGMMNLIGGEAELRLSAQLQGKLNEFRDSTTRTADALSASRSGSQAGDVERGRADQQMVLQDIQALQRIMTQILDSMSEQSRHATEATQKRGEILARV